LTEPEFERYVIVKDRENFLVIDMPRKGVAKFGKLLATCTDAAAASKIAAALKVQFPPTDAEDIA